MLAKLAPAEKGAAAAVNQINYRVDNNVRQNNYDEANDGINDGLSAFIRPFLVAGRGQIPEAADDEEQHRDGAGNEKQQPNNFADYGDDAVLRPKKTGAGQARFGANSTQSGINICLRLRQQRRCNKHRGKKR